MQQLETSDGQQIQDGMLQERAVGIVMLMTHDELKVRKS